MLRGEFEGDQLERHVGDSRKYFFQHYLNSSFQKINGVFFMSMLNKKEKVVRGISIRTRLLTDEVFSILVSGKEKGLSASVMCRNAGIKPSTLDNWLSDPYPVGAVKELQKVFAQLEGISFDSYQEELRRIAHEQATTGRVETYHPRKRIEEYETAAAAYKDSAMVKVAIEEVIAAEFCQALLAPVVAAYEDEKARILGSVG